MVKFAASLLLLVAYIVEGKDFGGPFLPTAVVRPPLPYREKIPFELQAGKLIEIRGSLHQEANRFEIYLVTGNRRCADDAGSLCKNYALGLNINLDDHEVLRNSYVDGWGEEERDGPFLFRKGHEFTLWILVEPDNFKILVDGERCYTFNHRIPAVFVRTLELYGDADIERIQFV